MKNNFPKITLRHVKNLADRKKVKEYIHKIFSVSKEPSNFAFSVAVGIFIGLFIPMGLQTVFIVPLSFMLGYNLFIAWIFTFISNPITVVPIYLFVFRIGEVLTGIEISAVKVNALLNNLKLESILALGKDGLLIFLSGAFTTAFSAAFVGYAAAFYLMKFYNKKYLSKNSL